MKVSVIIPVYNVEKYIEKCIQSILNQSFQDFEIVIINDATPDDSMLIVRKYAELDKRIKIFENPRNMGLMWTRREGYRVAGGDYLVFCDSDDWMPANAIEILYQNATEDVADIVVGSINVLGENSLQGSIIRNQLSYGHNPEAVYRSLLTGELVHSLCGKMYLRGLFEEDAFQTIENVTNGEDAALFYQLVAKCNKVTVVDEVVYCYYYNPNSSSRRRMTTTQIAQIIQVRGFIYSVLQPYPLLNPLFMKSYLNGIIGLLSADYDQDTIIKNNTVPGLVNQFKFSELRNYYSGLALMKNYLIIHNRFNRRIFHFLRSTIFGK